MGADGEQIGVISTQDALRQAQELDLDLVEVAPQADPPVCRIMDYGKYKYERDIRQKEARKKQSRVDLKEIKFRPKIDPHDYATKKGHVSRFLTSGAKVKVTIMFRGREMAHTDLGESIVVESMPKQEGRNMIMVIAPNKRYQEQRAKEAAANGNEAAALDAEAAPQVEVPAEVIEAVEAAQEAAQTDTALEEPQPDAANEG